MMKKEQYEAPLVECYEIALEHRILDLSNGANYSKNAGGAGGDDTINDYPVVGGSF